MNKFIFSYASLVCCRTQYFDRLEGADIVITYFQNAAAAAEVVEEIKALGRMAHAIECDAAEPGEVRETGAEIEREIGPVDILINNAGEISRPMRGGAGL
ncbi:SDR family NAD(P)-dependent oxidoreductase [Streptomyces sp. NPDC059679]|uniref:SDR family NAD(P)-dependent oxidoreductase n=1 Tax=Streptomyces sp. NPDC059679 TaxID=3346903 RepID=UPI003674E622